MKNLLIALLGILAVILVVIGIRSFTSKSDPATTTTTAMTAATPVQKTAQDAVAAPLQVETTPAAAKKQEEVPGWKPQASPANSNSTKPGDREKAVRDAAAKIERIAAKPNAWVSAGPELDAARKEHLSAVKDLIFNPAGDWKSAKYTVAKGDSLERIRKKVMEAGSKAITVGMIRKANRLEKDIIHPGAVLRIPQEEMKVIVDRASYTMRVYFGDLLVGFYRVGLGKPDQPTPTGTFIVGEKQKNPTWFPKGEKPVPYGDTKNPLGTRWLALKLNGAASGYGIHGTNDDQAVGQSISQGCVRMYNPDVEELSEILPEGTTVEIR